MECDNEHHRPGNCDCTLRGQSKQTEKRFRRPRTNRQGRTSNVVLFALRLGTRSANTASSSQGSSGFKLQRDSLQKMQVLCDDSVVRGHQCVLRFGCSAIQAAQKIEAGSKGEKLNPQTEPQLLWFTPCGPKKGTQNGLFLEAVFGL